MKNSKIEWIRAGGNHVNLMVALTKHHYQIEAEDIYTPEPVILSRNLLFAVVNQFYNPNAEYLVIGVLDSRIVAYLWMVRSVRCPWSDDEMLDWKIAHMDLSLSTRLRVQICNEMIDQSLLFAHHNKIPIICSSTIRSSQDAFLRIHEKRGFTIRGSLAYYKLLKNEVNDKADKSNNNEASPTEVSLEFN
jgi:hypothetical protein